MQKTWALLDRMILPKRGGGEVAVGLEELWMPLPMAQNKAWRASMHQLEIAFADNNKDP